MAGRKIRRNSILALSTRRRFPRTTRLISRFCMHKQQPGPFQGCGTTATTDQLRLMCASHTHSLWYNRHACSNKSGTFRMFLHARPCTVGSHMTRRGECRPLEAAWCLTRLHDCHQNSSSTISGPCGRRHEHSCPPSTNSPLRNPEASHPAHTPQAAAAPEILSGARHQGAPKRPACTQGSTTHHSIADHAVTTPCELNAGSGQ